MSGRVIEDQYFNVLPPRDGLNILLAVTAVSQSQDLTALLLPVAFDKNRDDHVFLTLVALTTNVFLSFSPAVIVVNPATVGQAGGVGYCIPAGTRERFRISRKVDKSLNFIGTGVGGLYIGVSSHTSQFGVGSQ